MQQRSKPGTSSKASDGRPTKPHPDFPLGPHAAGYWCKKVRGKIRYFGRIAGDEDGQAALALWLDQKDDLLAGRTPRKSRDSLTVADLCNRFLTAKARQRDAGEITARTWSDYKATTDRLVTMFGRIRPVDDLAADDFETLRADIAKQWGPVRLGNEVQRVRTVFKYGYESGLFDKPVRYGPQFRKPGAAVLRKHRAANGKRMFEASDLRRLLKIAPTQLKAMILLGVNCGFGNHDCATLPLAALDLTGAWLDYPRPKTGVARRCSLWPDTVAALQAALTARPVPKDTAAGFVFVTKHHGSWGADGNTSAITHEFRDLLNDLGLHRDGLSFYSLRHTFRTVADGARDQVAANAIMGHADATMAGVYRERMDDSRLKAVADFVHDWLFGEPSAAVEPEAQLDAG